MLQNCLPYPASPSGAFTRNSPAALRAGRGTGIAGSPGTHAGACLTGFRNQGSQSCIDVLGEGASDPTLQAGPGWHNGRVADSRYLSPHPSPPSTGGLRTRQRPLKPFAATWAESPLRRNASSPLPGIALRTSLATESRTCASDRPLPQFLHLHFSPMLDLLWRKPPTATV